MLHVRFPSLVSDIGRWRSQSIRFWKSAGFNNRNSIGVGERETPLLEGTQGFVYSRTQEKKQWPYKTLGQTCLRFWRDYSGGSYGRGSLQRQNPGGSSSGGYLLAQAFQESAIFSPRPGPTPQPVGFCAVWSKMPQTKHPAGWEHSPTHQQTGCLLIHSCPINTDLDTALLARGTRLNSPQQWAETSPSHEEAGTSPLDQSRPPRCRQQKQELQPCRTETTITVS